MTIARVVALGAVIVALAGCHTASDHQNAAATSPATGSSSTVAAGSGSTPTAPGSTTSESATPSTTASGTTPLGTTAPSTVGATTVPVNPSAVPALEVTSPQSGATVALPLTIQYRLTGVSSTTGLSLLVTIPPDYQVELPAPALEGSVSVPGSKTVAGLRNLTITTLDNGVAVASPGATATVTGLLIAGGR